MLNVSVIGATGYSGEELIRILLRHPEVKITSVSAKIDKPQNISELYPDLKGEIELVCAEPNVEGIASVADVVFLALPHTVSMKFAPLFLEKGKLVIDLSADYRLDPETYAVHYKTNHSDSDNLKQAVYGLPELNRKAIKKAKLIANPGCYPTAALLSLLPLLKEKIRLEAVFVDAKTGISGAGRKPELRLDEFKSQENLKAYKVNNHQHAPEIAEQIFKISKLKPKLVFVPHLIPAERGILETIYVRYKMQDTRCKIIDLYKNFYKNEIFVKVLDEGGFPELANVVKTNFCEIGIKQEKDLLIIVSAIDNLVKGASGQAVQNMNIASNFKETLGLL